jgi:hypothetical protein
MTENGEGQTRPGPPEQEHPLARFHRDEGRLEGTDWGPTLAGLFVRNGKDKDGDDVGRLYFSSERSLYVDFKLKDVESHALDAVRVTLKPDNEGVQCTFDWPRTAEDERTADDELSLDVRRESGYPPRTHVHFQVIMPPMWSNPHR